MPRLSEIEAALLVKMSPQLLRWFTTHCPKSGESRKLPFKMVDGEPTYDRDELLEFDEYLKEPWPHQAGKRPHVPEKIRDEIILEAHAECANCRIPHSGEAAHIKAVSKSFNNHPSNLIWLCASHHTVYDYGHKVHASLSLHLVRSLKERLVDSQMRLLQLEHRKSLSTRELIAAAKFLQEQLEDLAALPKALKGVQAATVQEIEKKVLAIASAVENKKSNPAPYRRFARTVADVVKEVKPAKASIALAKAREEYLSKVSQVDCPLCDGSGQFLDYDECPVCEGEGAIDEDEVKSIDLDQYKLVRCVLCDGTGDFDEYDDCPVCDGQKRIEKRHAESVDLAQYRKTKCPLCKGRGSFRDYDDCPECGGAGSLEARAASEVRLSDYDLVPCPRCKGKRDFCAHCDSFGKIERRHFAD